MNHFLRLFRLATRFPITLASAILLSFAVAAFWGGNIGAIYPVLEVVLRGRSMPEWISQEQEKAAQRIDQLEAQLASMPDDESRLADRRALSDQIIHERAALSSWARLRPHAERYLPGTPFQTVVVLLGALLVATAIKNVCIVAHAMLASRLVEKVTFELRQQVFQQILRMDHRSLGEKGTANINARFTQDVPHVATGLNWFVGRLVVEPLKLIACGIGAAIICWRLLLFSVLAAPAVGLLLRWLARRIKRENTKAYNTAINLNQIVFEAMACLPVVQAFTLEQREQERLHAAAQVCQKKNRKIAFLNVLTRPATELLGLTVLCLALLAGAYLVLNHQTNLFGFRISERPLSLASLLIFYGMLIGMTDPLRKMSDFYATIQNGLVAAGRVFEFIDRPSRIVEPTVPQAVARPHGQLEFASVGFSYTDRKRVLHDVSLTIPFGETVAIVGSNGCGKSTLISLAPRFHDPSSGSVRLGGVDLRDMSLVDLRSRIGLVTQQPLLFDDTIAANIACGAPVASFDDIVRAAKLARAHEFIERDLPHGYDSRCGECGGRLSGGQRQRIALARALLRNPELLILDEATSQVDLASEQLILDALRQVIGQRTTILITHRLSLLAIADRIVVMESGRIIDSGPHEELLQRCNVYRRLQEIGASKAA